MIYELLEKSKYIYIFKILEMSYEVFNEYKKDPSYNEFINKLHKIVNQMIELKEYYYNQCIKPNGSNHLTIDDNAYKIYVYFRYQKMGEVHGMEKENGFNS
jgi:hypothetical protein